MGTLGATGATGATGTTGATGATGATGPTAANNGLSVSSSPTAVQLGGALIQDTAVTFSTSNFALSLGDGVGPSSQPSLRLDNTPGISPLQTANAQFGGAVSYPVRVITAAYTIATDDHTVLCNNSAAPNIPITPPVASPTNKGRTYVVKRINTAAGACSLQNVDGTATHALAAPERHYRQFGVGIRHPVRRHSVVDHRDRALVATNADMTIAFANPSRFRRRPIAVALASALTLAGTAALGADVRFARLQAETSPCATKPAPSRAC